MASTSPEGTAKANENLAKKRAANLTSILQSELNFNDSLVTVTTNIGDWERLEAKIKDDIDVPNRAKVLEILASEKDPERKDLL